MRDSTLCYIEKDGCYLMMHRVKKKNDVNRDKWIGIGGGVEEGESPLDCIIREAKEETGLKLEAPYYRGLVTFSMIARGELVTEQMHLFTCDRFSGELITECSEGDLEWVPVGKAESLPIWEGDKIFLRLLQTEKRFFLLKLEYDEDVLLRHTLSFGGLQ